MLVQEDSFLEKRRKTMALGPVTRSTSIANSVTTTVDSTSRAVTSLSVLKLTKLEWKALHFGPCSKTIDITMMKPFSSLLKFLRLWTEVSTLDQSAHTTYYFACWLEVQNPFRYDGDSLLSGMFELHVLLLSFSCCRKKLIYVS